MSKHQTQIILLFHIIFLFSSLTFGLDDPEIGLEQGKILPSFKLPDFEGNEIALQDFRGSIVIIHLWKCK